MKCQICVKKNERNGNNTDNTYNMAFEVRILRDLPQSWTDTEKTDAWCTKTRSECKVRRLAQFVAVSLAEEVRS